MVLEKLEKIEKTSRNQQKVIQDFDDSDEIELTKNQNIELNLGSIIVHLPKLVVEIRHETGVTDKTARTQIYKEMLEHLAGVMPVALRIKTLRAKKIRKLFGENDQVTSKPISSENDQSHVPLKPPMVMHLRNLRHWANILLYIENLVVKISTIMVLLTRHLAITKGLAHYAV
ncbi:unnamed protein product [Rhizophagus irregularis]|nr:unnamed protein product [Rhizophagus irregularis]CAB5378123.1 unnamed protein product [Rhizophagus irregularis]